MSLHDLPFFPVSGGSKEAGKDGISPTITVTEIDGGHKLTIVDVTGTKNIDILNGTEADSVLYTEQNLTKEQQARARENIGALPATTEIPSIEGLATESYIDEKLEDKMDNITITPEDEGKFLMIQGGVVAKVAIPNIIEEVF
jgi:hypothetical protein